MRTKGCKNWRCRYYDTTMVLHCARSISKVDDRSYALDCSAYMPRVRAMVSLGHIGWVTLSIAVLFACWTAFGWMTPNEFMGLLTGCLLQWFVCAISFRRFG